MDVEDFYEEGQAFIERVYEAGHAIGLRRGRREGERSMKTELGILLDSNARQPLSNDALLSQLYRLAL